MKTSIGCEAFERQLLQSARADRVPEGARERVSARLGLTGVALGGFEPSEGTLAASEPASAGASTLVKPALGGLIGSVGVVGLMLWGLRSEVAPDIGARAVSPAPLALEANVTPLPARERFVHEPTILRATEPAKALPTPRVRVTRAAPSAAVSVTAPAPPKRPSDDLLEEVRQLDRARGDLQSGLATLSLAVLDDYDRRFPTGQLALDAAVLRVNALDRTGQRDAARSLAQRLLARTDSGRYRVELARLLAR